MAYIFDPIRNTFVDDEDTSLGNKLALNDEEFEKLLKIPGVFRASEAPQPPPRQEVLDREAINRFIRDNKAQGGRVNLQDGTDKLSFRNQRILDIKNFVENFKLQNKRLPTRDEIKTLGNFDYQFIKDRIDAGDIQTLSTTEAKKLGRKKVDLEASLKKQRETIGKKQPFIFTDGPSQIVGKVSDVTFPSEEIKNNYLNDLNKIFAQKYRRTKYKDPGVLTTKELAEKYFGKANDFTIAKIGKMNTFFADQLGLSFENLPIETKSAETSKRRKGRIVKARKELSAREKLINTQQDNLVNQINNYYKKFPGQVIKNPKLTNAILSRMNTDGTLTLKTFKSFNEKNNYLKNIAKSDTGVMSIDHITDVKLEKKNVEFPINRQLAPVKTNQSVVTRAKNLLKNNLNKTDSTSKKIVSNTIDSLNSLGLRVNVDGKVYGIDLIPAIDMEKGTLPNMDKAIDQFNLNEASKNFKINPNLKTKTGADGTPIKNFATSLKDKLDKSRMLSSKIPGGAVALTPLDFTLSMAAGLPLTESLASAGSYLIKDPYLGKAINIPLAIAQDMQDPEQSFERMMQRREKSEAFLQDLVDRIKEGAGDQPDIDPFQAAEGGRAGFSNGGATGMSSDEFVKELEYYFTNPDADLPKATTFRETMNPIEILNDMIDPRNYPYIADRLAKTGIRIGEFGLRVLPAVGKLIGDITTKPSFKVQGKTGTGYIQDYDQMPKSAKIKGTGIFSEFLDNLVGTEMTEGISRATGLDDLIKMEEQKMMDRRVTKGPKVLADTATLGMEFTAPIFPGLKLLKAYAKARKLPVDDTTKELLEKEIKNTLDKNGISRRDFIKTAGAGASLVIAKMLGFGDEFTKATKVVRPTVEQTTTGGVPPYFFELVKKIKKSGRALEPEFDPRVENNMQLGDYVMRENMSTGEISIQKTKEGMVDTGSDYLDGTISEETITYKPGEDVIGTDGKTYRTPDEYEEFTTRPDINDMGKMKDVEPGLDSIEEIIELMPNQLKRSELEAAGYNVEAFPDNIKQLLIDDLQKID